MFNVQQPFRLLVTQQSWSRGRTYKGRGPQQKGAYTAITPTTIGFVAWTADTTAEPAREGYGTFCFRLHAARQAVIDHLAAHRTRQISIRTNQDRTLFVINRHADGRVTHYDARD